MTNWVFEGAEVMKTGRIASRVSSRGHTDKLVEITPVHTTTGSWKKWVSETTLYQIETDDKEKD